eukprot:scpid100163/ scgid2497/ 
MSRQATLFGKAVKKQPFFKTAGDSDYYRTINCLWQLSKTTNKDVFFAEAKKEWTSKFANDATARRELFDSAKKLEGDVKVAESFVVHKEPGESSSSACGPSPALIEFVPYVLGCVSINNILLRTGGVGGWGRVITKL